MRYLSIFLVLLLFGCTVNDEIESSTNKKLIKVKLKYSVYNQYGRTNNCKYCLFHDSSDITAAKPFLVVPQSDSVFTISSESIAKGFWFTVRQWNSDNNKLGETKRHFVKPAIDNLTQEIGIGNNEKLELLNHNLKLMLTSAHFTGYWTNYVDNDFVSQSNICDLYLVLNNQIITNPNDHIDEYYPTFTFKKIIDFNLNKPQIIKVYDNNFGTIPDTLLVQRNIDLSRSLYDATGNDFVKSGTMKVEIYDFSALVLNYQLY